MNLPVTTAGMEKVEVIDFTGDSKNHEANVHKRPKLTVIGN